MFGFAGMCMIFDPNPTLQIDISHVSLLWAIFHLSLLDLLLASSIGSDPRFKRYVARQRQSRVCNLLLYLFRKFVGQRQFLSQA